MAPHVYLKYLVTVINVIAIFAFIVAFIAAEIKARIILTVIMALIILIPQFIRFSPPGWAYWVHYVAKVIFALGCLIYVKWKRYS